MFDYTIADLNTLMCMLTVIITELNAQDDIKLELYNPLANDRKTQAYIHPHGTVPTLHIEGREPILESGAICLYLADYYRKCLPDHTQTAFYYKYV